MPVRHLSRETINAIRDIATLPFYRTPQTPVHPSSTSQNSYIITGFVFHCLSAVSSEDYALL